MRKIMRKKGKIVALLMAVSMIVCGALAYAPTYSADKVATAAKKAKIASKKLTVNVGSKKTIKIKNKAKKASYSFKSSSKKVCSVSKKGVVKGKKAGKAKVTVKEKLNGKTRKLGVVKVTVKDVAGAAANTGDSTNPNGNNANNGNGTNNGANNGTNPNNGNGTNNGQNGGPNGGTNQDPNATATPGTEEPTEPTPEPTHNPFSVELFKLNITEGKVESVDGNTCKVDMQFFTGTAVGEWFSGNVITKSNVPGSDVIKTYKETGEVVHHARMFLEGTDILGNPCKLFIEDKTVEVRDDCIISKPIFVTDSSFLGNIVRKDLWGVMKEDEEGNKVITYYYDDSITDPMPRRSVTLPDSTPNKYTTEIFTFNISPGDSYQVNGENSMAMMIYFGGSSDCANFKGNIALSDADTRIQFSDPGLGRPDNIQTLSARYILSGTDKNGNPMKIYVENNGVDDNGMVTEPTIITDNPDFEYIENEQLHGTVSWETGLTIHMWATH